MNDIHNNTAFQEFLQKSCNEIETNDDEYQRLTKQSINAYNNLKKAFSEFVNISTKLQVYSENLMFKAGIYTAQNTAQNETNHNYDVINNSYMLRKVK